MKLAISIALLLWASPALASTSHGFRDAKAPAEATKTLNALPNIEMTCHWKIKGHTIGCLGLVSGAPVTIDIWSSGKVALYRACVGGVCSSAKRVKHTFGNPY
jgi:hypothetical protein